MYNLSQTRLKNHTFGAIHTSRACLGNYLGGKGEGGAQLRLVQLTHFLPRNYNCLLSILLTLEFLFETTMIVKTKDRFFTCQCSVPSEYLFLQTKALQHRSSGKLQEVFVFPLPKLRKESELLDVQVSRSKPRRQIFHNKLSEMITNSTAVVLGEGREGWWLAPPSRGVWKTRQRIANNEQYKISQVGVVVKIGLNNAPLSLNSASSGQLKQQ